MVCATPRLVLPASPILVEIIDWRRIGITVVEISDFRGDFGSCRMVFVCLSHREFAAVVQCAQTVASCSCDPCTADPVHGPVGQHAQGVRRLRSPL